MRPMGPHPMGPTISEARMHFMGPKERNLEQNIFFKHMLQNLKQSMFLKHMSKNMFGAYALKTFLGHIYFKNML
jgi:hypothetical protein